VTTSVIQALAIGYSLLVLGHTAFYHASQIRVRANFDALTVLRMVAYYTGVYPFFGRSLPWAILGAPALLGTLFLSKRVLLAYWEFPVAVLVLTVLSIIASQEMQGGPRYAYSASVILILLLLALCSNPQVLQPAKIAAGILLSASMVYWSLQYKSGLDGFRDPNWPVWSSEVKAWRLDPRTKLQAHPIWPWQTATGLVWAINLPPEPASRRPASAMP